MKFSALVIVGLSALAAAQTTPLKQVTLQDSEQSADQLQEKLQLALNNRSADTQRAHDAAFAGKQQMEHTSQVEAKQTDKQHKTQIQERLQNAINNLEISSEKVKAQQQLVQERIQSRSQERKKETYQHERQAHGRKQN